MSTINPEWSQAHGTSSARWTAPELMDNQEEVPLYTFRSDVYSFGMTALEVSILSPFRLGNVVFSDTG